ncbi:M56 family metallopeptidase [Streptomyces sp. DSM 41527]|uniref:M56 family metallopeptidase n=1 Tax=Streptomyces mooreae TaxID=3075523 RepID=A0ABU2T110_9ACTN|nr:M56 family metallopeptidase [Streptomyces sp. DSM 41527]MDT0454777.1 M56 family metallopeptidase [Streptomyces sp. DSM 41527]
MRVDVYVPLVLAALLAVAGPGVGRVLAPAYAARALVVTGGVTAATSVWALMLLGGTLLDDAPPVMAEAQENRLHIPEPVPEVIAVLAVALLVCGAYRAYRVVRTHRCTLRTVQRLRATHPADGELIVVTSATPQAFALPGAVGRIVVTSAMLAGLDSRERRVLLAHERAHLRHRHDRLRLVADLAAAVVPVLVPLRETVAFLLERWADEDAAETDAGRETTARAVARAALLSHRSRLASALHLSQLAVTRRVAALQAAPLPRTRLLAVAILASAILPAVGAADATGDFLHFLSHALTP